jgi:hypothetical protein
MRSVVLSLLGVLLGAAMVAGGIWGLIASDDDDDDSAVAATSEPKTSPAEDCAQVAQRDPRFRIPHDLNFGIEGKATVTCKGSSVSFSIEIDALKEGTFYEVVLEKGRREVDVGSILVVGVNDVNTVTVGPEVPLKKYDFLTVRVNEFHNPDVDQQPFRAAL